ncbi:MAG: DUF1566 domain-containing protein [Bacteroidetes bacterium]|nr:DUF1566 domain-containing protein [Bacteroidota bacterium]
MPLYINHPITGDKIQVAEKDFSDRMNWKDAMSACAGLGNGWRLPIKDELVAMYEQLHMQGKGNFQHAYYWSSSQISSGSAWNVSFGSGNVFNDNKSNGTQVRAVRAKP